MVMADMALAGSDLSRSLMLLLTFQSLRGKTRKRDSGMTEKCVWNIATKLFGSWILAAN
jgi:hypothetical protein